MKQIFDLLLEFWDVIKSIFELAIKLVVGLFDLLLLIPEAVKTLTEALNVLPPIVLPFCTATITISIIYMIVGRGGTE